MKDALGASTCVRVHAVGLAIYLEANVSRNPRNLVICLDGTGNSPTRNDTNVVRIFRLAQAMKDTNIAYYDPGIGTLPHPGNLLLLLSKIGRGFGSMSGHGML